MELSTFKTSFGCKKPKTNAQCLPPFWVPRISPLVLFYENIRCDFEPVYKINLV